MNKAILALRVALLLTNPNGPIVDASASAAEQPTAVATYLSQTKRSTFIQSMRSTGVASIAWSSAV